MLGRRALLVALLVSLCTSGFAKTHIITFGKTANVQWFVTPEKSLPIAVRPLYVDGKLREFTSGDAHDVTDSSFVVRRAYRINDYLPDDQKKVPNWKWQREPMRVTFEPAGGEATSFDIRGHSADVTEKSEKDDSAGSQ